MKITKLPNIRLDSQDENTVVKRKVYQVNPGGTNSPFCMLVEKAERDNEGNKEIKKYARKVRQESTNNPDRWLLTDDLLVLRNLENKIICLEEQNPDGGWCPLRNNKEISILPKEERRKGFRYLAEKALGRKLAFPDKKGFKYCAADILKKKLIDLTEYLKYR